MKPSKSQSIPNILITVLFTVLITIFVWASLVEIEDAFKSENRNLATIPEVAWDQSILSLPTVFSEVVSDQFPLRYQMIRLAHRVRYSVFQENFISSVIFGEDGWLYQNNRKSNDVCQNVVNWGDLEQYTEKLNTSNAFLEERGIDFAIAFIPEKCHIYSGEVIHLLPDLSRRFSTPPLIEHLTNTSDAPVISLFDVLNSQKDAGQLYFKNDLHWNTLGAYLGYQGLISGLMPGISPEELVSWNYEVDVKHEERVGDRGQVSGLPEFIYEPINLPDTTVLKFTKGTKEELIYDNPDADNDLTLVVFHDSFFTIPPISEYLATHYQKSIFLNINNGFKWSNDPERIQKVIDKWDPDIILVVYIERNIKLFIND